MSHWLLGLFVVAANSRDARLVLRHLRRLTGDQVVQLVQNLATARSTRRCCALMRLMNCASLPVSEELVEAAAMLIDAGARATHPLGCGCLGDTNCTYLLSELASSPPAAQSDRDCDLLLALMNILATNGMNVDANYRGCCSTGHGDLSIRGALRLCGAQTLPPQGVLQEYCRGWRHTRSCFHLRPHWLLPYLGRGLLTIFVPDEYDWDALLLERLLLDAPHAQWPDLLRAACRCRMELISHVRTSTPLSRGLVGVVADYWTRELPKHLLVELGVGFVDAYLEATRRNI